MFPYAFPSEAVCKKPVSAGLDIDGVVTPQSCSYCAPGVSDEINRYGEIMEFGIGLATGREEGYANSICEKNGIKASWLIAENGGVVILPDGERVVYRNGDSIKRLREAVVKDMRGDGVYFLSDGGEIYLPFFIEPKETMLTLSCDPRQAMGMKEADPEEVRRVSGMLDRYLEGKIEELGLQIKVERYRHPDAAEVVPVGLNKAYGLNFVAERLGSGPGYFAAVGDGENDMPMLETAGHPGTVANAGDSVKSLVRLRGGIVSEMEHGYGVIDILEQALSS